MERSEETIFAEAIEKSASEREAYLDAVCKDNPELRANVESLLEAYEAGSFLESPPHESAATIDIPLTEMPGTQISSYKLLQEIGQGGMGVVYMAEQTEPVRRKVALKIIKPGMDTRQVITRFEVERQALSLMDHPNIAKVLDAGTTASGRPFFVMELVKGQPITQYCDEKHLTPRERLQMLLPICQAIQHAHHKGIIHRDIKPTNILVAEYDEKPVPKVIDFGVAKAISQPLTEKTMFTGYGQIVGTIEYMSPEQAKVNQLDIDTRSDVYSLGVLMYELLTGTTPFDKDRLRQAAWDEMLRIIREEDPPKPSTRLSDSKNSLPSVCAQRQTEPARLANLVRGELDWIVMKALEKDRSRRYETANSFAADIGHYLNDEPVLACPPSAAYRFRKFVRRNKRTLVSMAILMFAVLAVAGSLGWAIHDRGAQAEEVARERTARETAIHAEVDSALMEAERFQEQSDWTEALSAAKRAEGLLAGGGSDEFRKRAKELRKDLEMVLLLDQIQLLRSELKQGNFNDEKADRAYAQAFADYGIDVTESPVEKPAAHLRGRPGVTVPLIVALDDWAAALRVSNPSRSSALAALAQAADRDPWRRKVRQAVRQKDRRALAALAASPDFLRQSPASILVLANALDHGLSESCIEMLRQAQQQYSDNFWINYKLGWELGRLGPRYSDEAVSFFRAALAIRPESEAACFALGSCFYDQGKYDEAIVWDKKAIKLNPKYAMAYSAVGASLLH